jgi:ankyrin repeat protein
MVRDQSLPVHFCVVIADAALGLPLCRALLSRRSAMATVWEELLSMLEADDALATSQETTPGDEDEEVQVLVDAVTECDLDKLDGCLQRFSSEPTQLEAVVNEHFDADGTTLLWLACQLGHEHIVERLIAAGADVNGVACGESTRKSCAKSSCLPRFGLHTCLSASQLPVTQHLMSGCCVLCSWQRCSWPANTAMRSVWKQSWLPVRQ